MAMMKGKSDVTITSRSLYLSDLDSGLDSSLYKFGERQIPLIPRCYFSVRVCRCLNKRLPSQCLTYMGVLTLLHPLETTGQPPESKRDAQFCASQKILREVIHDSLFNNKAKDFLC